VLHDFADPVIWLTLDPNVANKMYACVIHSVNGGIYVSSNINLGAASTWTKLSNPPRTEGHPYNIHVLNDGTLIAVYSGRRNAAGTFIASSGVFKSTNGGTSWTDISDAGMFYWTKDLIIDENDPAQNTFYCCVFSGWGGPPNGLGGIYKTTNRGTSWTKINSSDRVESCTINPNNANEMYFSTESEGLWMTSNLNVASPVFSKVTNYPFMHPVRMIFNPFNENELWVTSFGNGLKLGLLDNCSAPVNLIVSGVTSTTGTVTWDEVPSADSYRVTRKVTGGGTFNTNVFSNTITFTGLTPGTSNKITVKAKCDGVYSDKSVKVTINTPLRSGELNELSIYPNPAKSSILINCNNPIQKAELININGERINAELKTISSGYFSIDINKYPAGIYFLKLYLENEILTRQIIKID
jgi:hypothetical protein